MTPIHTVAVVGGAPIDNKDLARAHLADVVITTNWHRLPGLGRAPDIAVMAYDKHSIDRTFDNLDHAIPKRVVIDRTEQQVAIPLAGLRAINFALEFYPDSLIFVTGMDLYTSVKHRRPSGHDLHLHARTFRHLRDNHNNLVYADTFMAAIDEYLS